MKWTSALSVLAVAVGLWACGGSAQKPPSSPESAASDTDSDSTDAFAGMPDVDHATAPASQPAAGGDAPGGSEGSARSMLARFVEPNADYAALTKELRPTSADYKAMFDDETAAGVEAAEAELWDSGKVLIKPKNASQTEVKVWGATGSELAAGTGHASEFPGGYKKLGSHLAPTVTFYAFKFVQPGKSAGMAYDGLAYVNGHWVIAPKPWHADEGHPDAQGTAGKAQKHPKGKKKAKGKKKPSKKKKKKK